MSDPGNGPERTSGVAPDEEQPSAGGMPRWAKISLIVVGALVALFIVLNLAGLGGEHGPGRHMPGAGSEHRPMDHSR